MTSIFEGQPPQKKQGRNSNQTKGHLGSRYILYFFYVHAYLLVRTAIFGGLCLNWSILFLPQIMEVENESLQY